MSLVSLENPDLIVEIEPARGGTITRLNGGPSRDDWLFYEPERAAGRPADHPVYDDVWRGGFEELFPNDAPGEFEGWLLPDHGELWSQPFEVVSSSRTAVHLRRRCTSVPADVEKTVSIEGVGPAVTIAYRLLSRAAAPLWHLFKLHCALRVEAGDRLLLPGGSVAPVEPGFGTITGAGPFQWPMAANGAGAAVDLSLVRPEQERFREFVYVAGLPEGSCGIRRQRTGESLRLTLPLAVFPCCWLFLTYGGWRGYNTAVLEPCTNLPKDLSAARERGTCAVLKPGEVREFAVRLEVRGPHAK